MAEDAGGEGGGVEVQQGAAEVAEEAVLLLLGAHPRHGRCVACAKTTTTMHEVVICFRACLPFPHLENWPTLR